MPAILSLPALQTALEVGAIYSLVAMALFISFSILNIADLSTDGCYTLGFAVGATVTLAGHPLLALPAAMLAGACSGFGHRLSPDQAWGGEHPGRHHCQHRAVHRQPGGDGLVLQPVYLRQ